VVFDRPADDLAGRRLAVLAAAELNVVPAGFFEQRGMVLRLGDRALAIDRERKCVRAASGVELPYDKLVLASGSTPFVPPLPGRDRPECFVYRTIEDLEAIRSFLVDRLPQHEEEEEAAVYPVVARLMGGEDPMASMARAHVEISHLTRVYRSLVDDLPSGVPGPEDLTDLRRVLYGLHAILRLHFAQEEEAYAWLAAEGGAEAEARATASPTRTEPASTTRA